MQNDDFEYGFGNSALTIDPEPPKPELKRKITAKRRAAKDDQDVNVSLLNRWKDLTVN